MQMFSTVRLQRLAEVVRKLQSSALPADLVYTVMQHVSLSTNRYGRSTSTGTIHATASRTAVRFALAKIAVRCQIKVDVYTAATVQTRMQSLAAFVPQTPAMLSEDEKLDLMVANFTNAFCRRCRIFNCFAHTGPHIK